jgi:NADH-quinone oxidoreductase subunit G
MPTVKVTIDGTELECDDSLNVIQAAALLGKSVPHYCWHPDMTVSGNCRMCLVEIETPRGPKADIACNTRVSEGMVVNTENDSVKRMREQVLEFLFLNHPLDCPICDKAGECLLQDYYQEHGLYEPRLDDDIKKVGKGVKAERLSELIVFDNERCILCDRCVRFCREVEGKEELYIGGRGSPSKIVMFPGKQLTGEYQLCLSDICPVGALTSTAFRFNKRVWFLEKAKSVCGLRDTGDTIFIEYKSGNVYRVMPRRHDGINGVWVKDVSRLAYRDWEADRLTVARQGDRKLEFNEALMILAHAFRTGITQKWLLVVDNRLTLEEAYALKTVLEELGNARSAQADGRLTIERGPNGHGLDMLGFDRFEDGMLDSAEMVLAVGDFKEDLLKAFEAHDNLFLVTAHDTLLPDTCKLIVPLNEHMERTGTFVNNQNRVQRARKAFDAPLPNANGVELAVFLAKSLGRSLAFSDQKQAFSEIARAHLDRPGMRWKDLGDKGILLQGEEHPKTLSSLSSNKKLTWSG